ncbi:MAG TPA: amino acid ABC transporter permease, partial [Candidatus Latescibacteria bacterium]|nr:amino acid ABC transporter permease [Candidatus Latescibacterota bacterium]
MVCCLWVSPVIAQPVTIGSKNFTENVILGEVLRHLAQHAGQEAIHRQQLGGTQILWEALLRGDLDAYAEYTGTLTQEVLADLKLENNEALEEALKERGILMSRPLGFNNTYALGMKPGLADSLGIIKISDLRDHPDLIFAFGNEFLDRGDGWPTLRNRYGLPQTNVSGLDHDLSYRGLESGDTHVIDLYSTDAEIAYYKLRVL